MLKFDIFGAPASGRIGKFEPMTEVLKVLDVIRRSVSRAAGVPHALRPV